MVNAHDTHIHVQEAGAKPSLRLEYPDGRRFEISIGSLTGDPARVRTEIARWAAQWHHHVNGPVSVCDPTMGMPIDLQQLETPPVSF